jgi:raffinose/stachyose/melibiose transport system permease protein
VTAAVSVRRSSGRAVRTRDRSRVRNRLALGYPFLIPALIFYLVVIIYPTVAGGYYAFTDWSAGGENANFVGVQNFVALLHQIEARAALANTVIIALACTILQTVIGLALAVILNTKLATRNVLRTLFFVPALLPSVIIAFLWQYILTPVGPLNQLLRGIGLEALAGNWLGDQDLALASVIGVIIWQNAGLTMVIYLAGLQGIPAELYEAAELDGASAWRRLLHITLPQLMPATTIAMSLTLISSLKLFDQVFVMTGGGPGYATQNLSVIMYKQAFVSGEYGSSAAIALVLCMIVFAFAILQLKALGKLEDR